MREARQHDRTSAATRLRSLLAQEFARRRKNNPRYSLRAFGRSLQIEHSTISQMMRGRRALTWKAIRRIARDMRWDGAKLMQVSSQNGFNSAATARRLGISVDEVNVALTDLCLFGVAKLNGEKIQWAIPSPSGKS